MVSFTLKSAGYKVPEAHDGVDAPSDKVRSADIDLLLTDQNMPRMDGLSLATLRAMSRYQRFADPQRLPPNLRCDEGQGVPRGHRMARQTLRSKETAAGGTQRWSVSQSLSVHRRKQWQST